MKKTFYFPVLTFTLTLTLIFAIMLGGCQKESGKNADISDVMNKIKQSIGANSKKKLTEIETATRYGVSPEKIEDGYVLTHDDKNRADEIILLKAKTQDDVQDLERAMQAEIQGLSETWEKTSKTEYDKIRDGVVKTRGKYVILAVTDKVKEVEEIFNREI